MNSQDKSAPKIGIVIPIYNVAKYLRECLDSVANQTYGNFCAVLVNDGSTDFLEGESTSQSLQIALEYVAKDSRFVLIDKKNGGQSSARNVGIKYFNNEITFCNESSLRGVANAEAIQIYRHTEPLGEVSKPSELNKSNESMAKERINNSHKFTQSKQIVSDSKVAKMDSSLTSFAQNDESIHDSAMPNLAMTIYADNITLYHNAKSIQNSPKIDYIIFLDSDDFWEVDLLEKCVDSALKHKAQIVWFSWKTFYDGIANVNGGGNPLGLAFMATHKRAS